MAKSDQIKRHFEGEGPEGDGRHKAFGNGREQQHRIGCCADGQADRGEQRTFQRHRDPVGRIDAQEAKLDELADRLVALKRDDEAGNREEQDDPDAPQTNRRRPGVAVIGHEDCTRDQHRKSRDQPQALDARKKLPLHRHSELCSLGSAEVLGGGRVMRNAAGLPRSARPRWLRTSGQAIADHRVVRCDPRTTSPQTISLQSNYGLPSAGA
jgi:hypothetical protein